MFKVKTWEIDIGLGDCGLELYYENHYLYIHMAKMYKHTKLKNTTNVLHILN